MNLWQILKTILIWQAVIIVITIAAVWLPLRENYLGVSVPDYTSNPLLYSRANFDGNHYLSIARSGYGYAQQAFFPMYPKLISVVSKYVKSEVLTGVVISLTCFVIASYFLVKLLAIDYGLVKAKYIWALMLIFPTSFFFGSVYTESLFLMLIVISFYLARRGHWGWAAIIGAVASYTRVVGILLLPALVYEAVLQYKEHKLSLYKLPYIFTVLSIISLGLAWYVWYLWNTTGDPLSFIHAQSLFGQGRSENLILLYQVFWRYIKMVFTVNRADPLYLTIIFEFITGILFLITSIMSFIRVRMSYAIFGLLAYLLPTLSGTFTSIPRYVLVCFPSFIVIAIFLSGRPKRVRKLYYVVSILAGVLFTSMFVRGYWVS